jgi:hypothetical protein
MNKKGSASRSGEYQESGSSFLAFRCTPAPFQERGEIICGEAYYS